MPYSKNIHCIRDLDPNFVELANYHAEGEFIDLNAKYRYLKIRFFTAEFTCRGTT
ncbi:MAG: hypothetical protein WAU23_06570 [Ferruginibacter sp.]